MKARRVMALLVGVVATSLCLAGCGGSDDEGESGSILGTWTWAKMVVNGITVNMANPMASTIGGSTEITPQWIANIAAGQGVSGANVTLTITFNADGTVTGSAVATAPGEGTETFPGSGTWSVNGNRLTVTVSAEGETVTLGGTYTATASKLTITMSNQDILNVLNANAGSVGQLPPAYQQILAGLSGSIEFTR